MPSPLPSPLPVGMLALGLLRAADAMNDSLLDTLRQRGWPPITHTQSLVFAHLDPAGTSTAELARRIGVTRQSMHTAVRELVDHGLLAARPDREDRRAQLVVLTARGRRLAASARRILAAQEQAIEARLGADVLHVLREALGGDWRSASAGAAPG